MSDSAPEPTREPDARHQTAVPSPKRLAFAGITSLGVSLLTLAYVISEYGSRLKNISDGLIENVCSVNQETLWDEFLYRLIGCRTVYESVSLQGHRIFIHQSYFNDPCQIKYGVTGLTALFRLPAAMYYTIHRLLIDSGVIGFVLVFILPLSFRVWIGLKNGLY
jgi:hypothetical protein